MAKYYVTNSGTLPAEYADYTLVTPGEIRLAEDSQVVIAGDVDSNVTINDEIGNTVNIAVEVEILDDTTAANANSSALTFGENVVPSVHIGEDVNALKFRINAELAGDSTEGGLTLVAESGSQVGDIDGDISIGSAGADNITIKGTVENIDTSSGDDTVVIDGGTVNGGMSTEGGDDTVILTNGALVTGGDLTTGTGNDEVSILKGSTVVGDGIGSGVLTGENADTVTVDADATAQIYMGVDIDGDDIAIVRYGDDQAGYEAAIADNYQADNDNDGYSDANSNALNDGFTYNNITFSEAEGTGGIICFAAGTLILTDRGEVPVEALRQGDLVVTRDCGPQPIRWIGGRRLGADHLAANPNQHPIRIRAGALGPDMPARDLVVSPQHRVLVRSAIARRMFGAAEVLVAAKQLLQIDGIEIASDLAAVTYVHFLCNDHQIVRSNGAETESLYTGAQALKSVGRAAQEEIFAIFPELRDRTPDQRPDGARLLLNGREGRKLAQRHAAKQRALLG